MEYLILKLRCLACQKEQQTKIRKCDLKKLVCPNPDCHGKNGYYTIIGKEVKNEQT